MSLLVFSLTVNYTLFPRPYIYTSTNVFFSQDLRNSDNGSEILAAKISRAREALSQVPEQGVTTQSAATPGKTLSASFGPKWPYKRTMSAPASIVPRQDSKMGIPLTFPFPKIFFSNQVLVPSTEKVYSRQISAPILKRKTSRFGLGQFLSGSSNNNASTSTTSQLPTPVNTNTSTNNSNAPLLVASTTGSITSTLSHPHHPFSIHSHQVHPASSGLQSQPLLSQGNCCGTPHNSKAIAVVSTGSGLSVSPSIKGIHHHPHHFHSTRPQHHLVHHPPNDRPGDSQHSGHGSGNGGQGRPRACMES